MDTLRKKGLDNLLNETEGSQGFGPDTERECKEHDHYTISQGQASGSCQDQASVGFQEQGAVTTQEHGDNIAFRGSQRSSIWAKSPSPNHVSQMNLDSAKEVSFSQFTSEGRSTSSQNNQFDSEHVPLNRHYRAVLAEFQHVKPDDYFATNDDLERCSRGIYQLFEIYCIKLREAQRKCQEKLEWLEPVKSGQHQSKTIDIKKRGKVSVYVELSADDADFKEQKPEMNTEKQSKKVNKKSENECGYDLPELIIENESSNESVSHGHIARKSLQSKLAEKEVMTSETRLYGFDIDDIVDDTDDAKSSYGRGRPRIMPSKETEAANNAVDIGKESRPTPGGPSRRPGRSTRNICPSPQTVPAKETQQEDLDLQEALRVSKCVPQRSVSEVQHQDVDMNWLNIKQQDGHEVFEKQMHKTKLHGYSIPKIGHSRGHRKIISPKQNYLYKNVHTESASKNEVMDERHLDNMPKEVYKDETQSRHKPKENNKDFKENMPPTRGKKCKANQLTVTTLAEDTQDIDGEESHRSRRKRTRRNCFKLDSDSEDESIAESQDIDGVSEDTVIENKQSDRDVKKNNQTNVETESKSPGFMASVLNKVRNFVSPAKPEEGCVMEMINEEAGSQSPVLNKKRKLYTAAPKKYFSESTSDKNNIECEFEALRYFKSSFAEKKKLSNSAAGGKDVKMNSKFDKSNDSKDNKESNVLDVVDSSTILDGKGDLYSTQYCEIKSRKGNEERSKSLKTRDEADEILILDESGDEVYVMTEPEIDTNVYGEQSSLKRRRKASETITRAEVGARCPRGGQEDVVGEHWGHVKGSLRKIGRHRGDDGNDDPGLRKTVVEMVACPLCNDSFPSNSIEHHAANCVGDIEPEEDSDDHVKDVSKHIRCSPGGEGEIGACYICDAPIPKGIPLELHVNQCLALATQHQMEVDKTGYHKVFTEPKEEAIPARNLRGRLRNPKEQIKAPRTRQHIDPATIVGTEEENDGSSLYGRK